MYEYYKDLGLEDLSNEEWRNIIGFEGKYQISSLGRVKSVDRLVPCKGNNFRRLRAQILRQSFDKDGYLRINLRGVLRKTKSIHMLVSESFLGHVSDGTTKIVVDHINNVRTDNRVENLQLVSHRENLSKDRKNGTSKYPGIYWNKNAKQWKAEIGINKKRKYLGYFNCELEAAQAYQKALKEHLNNDSQVNE